MIGLRFGAVVSQSAGFDRTPNKNGSIMMNGEMVEASIVDGPMRLLRLLKLLMLLMLLMLLRLLRFVR